MKERKERRQKKKTKRNRIIELKRKIYWQFIFTYLFISLYIQDHSFENNDLFFPPTPAFPSNVQHANNAGSSGDGGIGSGTNNTGGRSGNGNNLNINLPDNNAILRLEVELRDKNIRRRHHFRNKGFLTDKTGRMAGKHQVPTHANNYFVPMEKVCKCKTIYVAYNEGSFFFFFLHYIWIAES